MGHAPPRPKPDKSVGGWSRTKLLLAILLFVRIATWAGAVIGAVTGGMTLLIGAALVFGAAQGAAMLLTPRLVARRDSVAGWVDEDRELVEDIVRRFLADEFDQAEFERLVEERLASPVEVKRYKEPPPNRRTAQGQDARIVGLFSVPSHVMSRNSHGEPSAANPDCPLFPPPAFETEGLAE